MCGPERVFRPAPALRAGAGLQLVRNEKPAYNAQLNNGFKPVNTILLKPILLNKANVDMLVKDGFYTQGQLAGK